MLVLGSDTETLGAQSRYHDTHHHLRGLKPEINHGSQTSPSSLRQIPDPAKTPAKAKHCKTWRSLIQGNLQPR